MNKEILKKTFTSTSLAALYVFGVTQIMQNAERLFADNEFLAPFAFLMLFCLSAALMAVLIFGRSIFLFLENKKKESVLAAFYSIGWLGFYFVITVIILLLIR